MRAFFNSLALSLLAISLVCGVLDIARSVALTRFTLRSVFQILQEHSPEYLAGSTTFIQQHFWNGFWDDWMTPLLNMPAWLLFLILSILFYAVGSFCAQSREKGRL